MQSTLILRTLFDEESVLVKADEVQNITMRTVDSTSECRAASSIVYLWFFAVLAACSTVQAEPLVGNVKAEVRPDGSRYVDIHYDLSGGTEPVTVTVAFSGDGGQSWDIRPQADSLSGDFGPMSTNGKGKHIVWDAASHWRRVQWDKFRAKVIAAESPDGKTVVLPLPAGVNMEMVPIPSGSFRMGSPKAERGRSKDEGPLHTVNIDYEFYMGKYEVTQAQWLSLMDIKPYKIYGIGDDYPVFKVSWNHCRQFVNAMNQLGLGHFRLPSEAEWEYACRAGTKSRYYFGDSLECADYCADCATGKGDKKRSDYMWYCGNNVRDGEPEFGCKPVGQKLPNAFGLYDMHGNVWEWCQDEYHFDYKGAPTDGSAWQRREGAGRVLRGGAWDYRAEYCRSACRCGYSAHRGYTFHGFRLVWLPYCKGSDAWFKSWQAIQNADNIVSYQSQWGGWPKNMGFSEHGYQGEKFTRNWGSTIDNGATFSQLAFLAKAYHATGKKRFKDSFLRGLDYLLEAQYENGGWPQRYPLDKVGNDYGDYITFNDDAMVGVMRLMREIANRKPQYSFLDRKRRAKCEKAVRKGMQCILNSQVIIDGKRSIWPQQCDEKTLEPRAARAFEPVALCSRESVSIVKFLMEIENPSSRVIEAIQSAVIWFDRNKMMAGEGDEAYPTWARFYEIQSSRAVYAGTDAKVKFSLKDLDKDKRTGYSYGGEYATLLLVRDYPAWQKKCAPAENVLAAANL